MYSKYFKRACSATGTHNLSSARLHGSCVCTAWLRAHASAPAAPLHKDERMLEGRSKPHAWRLHFAAFACKRPS